MKKILLIFAYFVVLLIILGVLIFMNQNVLPWNMSVTASPYQTRSHPNIAYVKIKDANRSSGFKHESVRVNWAQGSNVVTPVVGGLSDDGSGSFEIPYRPNRIFPLVDNPDGGNVEGCSDLVVDHFVTETWLVEKQSQREQQFVSVQPLQTARVPCDAFTFFSKPGVMQLSLGYLGMLRDMNENPEDLNDIVVPSAFVTGVPNEILFANYIDGKPYKGAIEIEQLDAQEGGIHEVIQADTSGITAIELTIQKKARFRFTVGDKTIDTTFVPQPFNVKIEEIRPRNHNPLYQFNVSQAGEPNDLYVDLFSDYAWIGHDTVLAAINSDFLIPAHSRTRLLFENNNITKGEENPVQFKEPQILFLKIGTSELPSDDSSQTFAFVITGNQRDYRLELGAIYQTFARIQALNDERRLPSAKKSKSAYDAIVLIAPYLLNRVSADNTDTRAQVERIEKYLLAKLASAHHPEIVTLMDTGAVEKERVDAQNTETKAKADSVLILWLVIGLIGFIVVARAARLRRQQAWFDAAAKGEAEGLLPGAPPWCVMIIVGIIVGIIASGYYLVHLLSSPWL